MARRNQRHALGFFLNPGPVDGHSVRTGAFLALFPAALKGPYEDQRRALKWADVRAPN